MCNCPSCKWPMYTRHAIKTKCPMCNAVVECDGESVPTDEPLDERLWPGWCNLIKRFRKPTDAGIGDTVKRIADRAGGEAFKKISAAIGIPCGCTERQARWNKRYPYQEA